MRTKVLVQQRGGTFNQAVQSQLILGSIILAAASLLRGFLLVLF